MSTKDRGGYIYSAAADPRGTYIALCLATFPMTPLGQATACACEAQMYMYMSFLMHVYSHF